MQIAISKDLQYRVHRDAGRGTNNKAEAMALWGILWLTNILNISEIHIYGDSNIILDHVKGIAQIKQSTLLSQLRRIECIWAQRGRPSINHTSREHNQLADELSKKGLLGIVGEVQMDIVMEDKSIGAVEFTFPGWPPQQFINFFV